MGKYNLERFINAQKKTFSIALEEIKSGKKRSHWMWFILPQLKGLGYSDMAIYYGIENLEEAELYAQNSFLRENLITIANALLALDISNPILIFGSVDAIKLRSCMTLFEIAMPKTQEFSLVLEKFYNGERDKSTLELLNK